MIYTVTLNPALDRELTVPELACDTVLRATATRVDVGGKGFNVSRMLAVLGLPSVALGFAGGHTGEILRDGLEALGIATDFVWIAGETRTNTSIVAEHRQHHLKVNEPGPTISAEACAMLRTHVQTLLRRDDWWVLAGSLPPGVPLDFYADLIGDVQAAGAHAVLDTSGAALRAGCAARPMLIKPNTAEAEMLTARPLGTPEEALAAASSLDGIAYVVISMGAAGALLAHAGRGWLALPPAIQERNPIGAGDAMVAGLVWGLSQHDALRALVWGVACGAAAASHDGTAVGTPAEVARLAQHVQVRELV
jgi:1-phosphofructokinase family hexose kinase